MARSPQRFTQAIRAGIPSDIPAIVRVTNRAYVVEAFCLLGDRTDAEDVRARMEPGRFLVVEDLDQLGRLKAAVYLSITGERGYLGTLAVAPEAQGQGLAKALVATVEAQCRLAGCRFLDITVVNLREELFPFYARRGFAPSGILPFPRPDKILQPLHLVQMTKPLPAPEAR